jgi:arylsulfatase A-like enzyme
MCAVWHKRIPAGSRGAPTGLACDLFPTVCEAAGAPVPSGLDGRSLLGALLGKPAPAADRDLVWVRREGGLEYQGREYYALRRGDWKLLQNSPFERYQLFNLREDPQETRDLSKQEPKIFRELSAALMRHVQRAGRVPWQRS